jgi:hypothetical protein
MADHTSQSQSQSQEQRIDDKQHAEVLDYPSSPSDTYIVHYGDDEDGTPIVAYEPNTVVNQLLFGVNEGDESLYDVINGSHSFGYTEGDEVWTDVDVHDRSIAITTDGPAGRPTQVPPHRFEEAIDTIIRAYEDDDPDPIRELHDDIQSNEVDVVAMRSFMDRWPADRTEWTDRGVEIDETFVVTYEADTHLINGADDHVHATSRSGPSNGQAVEFDFDVGDESGSDVNKLTPIEDPHGYVVECNDQELAFLASIECLLYPEEHLGVELVDEVQSYRQEHAEQQTLDDVISEVAGQGNRAVDGFTDPTSGIPHDHGFGKHTLDDLSVSDETRSLLHFSDFDHAGPHEMLARRREFENAPFDVFEDTADNTSPAKWDQIESTAESAWIPPSVENDLDRMFG